MKFKWLPVLLIIWTAGLLLAVLYAASNKAKYFDPQNVLHQSALSLSFDTVFVEALSQYNSELTGSVIHFQRSDCFCQTVAQSHINSVEKLAENHQFNNVTVTLDEPGILKSLVPSVPAVAVIDKFGKLNYFGPYSSGMFCTEGDGLVEPFIGKDQSAKTGATVISQSKGCYCNLNSA
ncbi:DUF6436 domain-containing protein [Pseudoalteromonas phenolica]|uniref:DUF6436 domain-containing protein n=1 Tax=Pseudoalteromonas phenolica TaxID=161398 RepID=UPI00110BDB43|nr:DUF6436 domain-containing protein [Pseudoalteromonas phenolica]TMO57943.1 hypothetical protein CWC21_01425 [Pseudoalteromonas phenolica]